MLRGSLILTQPFQMTTNFKHMNLTVCLPLYKQGEQTVYHLLELYYELMQAQVR